MQTEHFTMLIGHESMPFKVPEGLLIMYSPVFEHMCSGPFRESNERLIRLPEERPSVFKDFFLWIHSLKPELDFSKGTESVFALAIFAEKYQIHHLINQTSDLIESNEGKKRMYPEILELVYNNVPKGAVLRQLCAWVLNCIVNYGGRGVHQISLHQLYGHIFSAHADLGEDFFEWASDPTIVHNRRKCRFHDHSNIKNPIMDCHYLECPYSDIFIIARADTTEAAKHPAEKGIVKELKSTTTEG